MGLCLALTLALRTRGDVRPQVLVAQPEGLDEVERSACPDGSLPTRRVWAA